MIVYITILLFLALYCTTWNLIVSLLLSFVIFNIFGGYPYTSTLYRDLYGAFVLAKMKTMLNRYIKSNSCVIQSFEETVSKYPQKHMFKFEGRNETFSLINERAEKVATYFQSIGVEKNDCVALFLENSPDLVTYWIGGAKIGAVSALINFNLRQQSLAHCLNVCEPSLIVCSASLLEHLSEIFSDLASNCQIYVHVDGFLPPDDKLCPAGSSNVGHLDYIHDKLENLTVGYVRPNLSLNDKLLYIYTSGTTGFPKAAKITNYRFIFMAAGVGYITSITSKDIIWSPLPLYHSNAGILGVGQCIYNGSCVAFRRKFSASKFWKDIVESEATIFQYLGEICRYVYKQPPCSEERQHKLRTIIGNGLKRELWLDMQKRYGIPHVMEIYGSTEGNCNMLNLDETPGSCGFMSLIFPAEIQKVYLLKCDDQGNLIRDKKGLCLMAKPGEQGHIVGTIVDEDPLKQFDGYVGDKQTSNKIVRNIKKHGDRAFVSGDILMMDKYGYLFFKDRTGDTFRWKGENVSTSEVETVILKSVDHRDVIVYGVEIPGTDGRAGMAAILNDDNRVDMSRVSTAVMSLPSYARPIFVRLLPSASQHLTGTYKLRKVDLQKEGFNLDSIKDPMWFWVSARSRYEPLTRELYENILNNKIML